MWDNIHEAIKDDTIQIDRADKLKQKLLSEWLGKEFPNLKVVLIQDDIFAIGNDKWVSFYRRENGEILFNIGSVANEHFVKNGDVQKAVWFGLKRYTLHKILWFHDDGSMILDDKPIDNYSQEAYKIWRDINFYSDVLSLAQLKKNPTNLFSQEDLKIVERDIGYMIKSGACTIDDIEDLYWLDKSGKQDKDLQKISEDFFKKAIKKIVEEKLLLQCGDERLDEAKQWITQEKLVHYYNKGYISVGMAENCRAAIQRKVEKKQSGGKIGDTTEKKLDELKK